MRKLLSRSPSAYSAIVRERELSIEGLGYDVRSDTAAGRLFLGLLQRMRSAQDFGEQMDLSRVVEQVTGIPWWKTMQVARSYGSPPGFYVQMRQLFEQGQYGEIFETTDGTTTPHITAVSVNRPSYRPTDTFVRLRFDLTPNISGNYEHANVYMILADGTFIETALTNPIHDTLFVDIPMEAITSKMGNAQSMHIQLRLQVRTNDGTIFSQESDDFLVEKNLEASHENFNTWDRVTNDRIQLLHPILRFQAAAFIIRVEMELGIRLRITNGYRTINEQNNLYEQGRTRPGPIVTWVRGEFSYHNYGLAIDVAGITTDNQLNYNLDWNSVAAIGQQLGFEWGGTWDTPDRPHFQFTAGMTTEQLYNLYNSGSLENDYVIIH